MKLTSGRPLNEIATACERIASYCHPLSLERFKRETHWQDAIAMNFVVIGEALSELRSHDPEVFHRIPNGPAYIGLRHRIAHGYRDIDSGRLWDFAGRDIPQLHVEAKALLEAYRGDFGYPEEAAP